MIPEALPALGGKADLEPFDLVAGHAPPIEVGARIRRRARVQHHAIVPHRHVHDIGQFGTLFGLLGGAGIAGRHLHPGLLGQDLDRLHEGHVFIVLEKADGVALGVTAKAVVEPLAVIHMKRRGFFLMEGARGPPVALGLVGLALIPHDLLAHDRGQADAIAQFVEETGRQTHGASIRACWGGVQRA